MKDDLLEKSMQFVEENIFALSNEIPEELLDFWLTETIHPSSENDDQWTIFMLVFVKLNSIKKVQSLTISPNDLVNLFEDWQILLATIKASIISNKVLKPIAVFDFENIKHLEFQFE